MGEWIIVPYTRSKRGNTKVIHRPLLLIAFLCALSFAPTAFASDPYRVYSHFSDEVQIGEISSPEEICAYMKHPFFSSDVRDIDANNSTNGYLQIGDSSFVADWFAERLGRYSGERLPLGAMTFVPTQETADSAIRNLAKCLQKLSEEDQGAVAVAERLIHALDFGYSDSKMSGRYLYETEYLALLTLKEARPVLEQVLNIALDEVSVVAQARAEQEKDAAEVAARQLAESEALAQREKADQNSWLNYENRERTLLEEVMNYSSSGLKGGGSDRYWVQTAECYLEERGGFGQRLLVTDLDMTSFRVKPVKSGVAFGDDNISFYGVGSIDIDRVTRAWRLAFDQCPGRSTSF